MVWSAALSRQKYLEKCDGGVEEYFVTLLRNSDYPDSFPRQHEVFFNPQTKIALVEYSLPSLQHIPKLKEVKYIRSRGERVEKYLSDAARNKLYDDVIYQIALRAVHELYQMDVSRFVESIVFNGWVKSINPATGKETNTCVVSVQVGRDEFSKIDLAQVEPKACFKALKGIGSSTLHSLMAIAPIIVLNREDKRFVPSYNVAGELSDAYNLAAMEWEDFEHLIREVFEKEFVQYGGEVKVTRASRDHGVDAVVFDPDPIRGGKIIIQAKRYTNTVDVSAVRDLYGTVINEGASKGILVTTADYGADAYEFAKGKPITLLNGNNLLHLLAKHGHKAKIDLIEAKKIIAERERQASAG